jgi:hypothetical protein
MSSMFCIVILFLKIYDPRCDGYQTHLTFTTKLGNSLTCRYRKNRRFLCLGCETNQCIAIVAECGVSCFPFVEFLEVSSSILASCILHPGTRWNTLPMEKPQIRGTVPLQVLSNTGETSTVVSLSRVSMGNQEFPGTHEQIEHHTSTNTHAC